MACSIHYQSNCNACAGHIVLHNQVVVKLLPPLIVIATTHIPFIVHIEYLLSTLLCSLAMSNGIGKLLADCFVFACKLNLKMTDCDTHYSQSRSTFETP